ncbi:MAG: MinD/ParA family protein [Solirubrobacterales bacterium]|nr:MinD/ParA family protein [Solirubrobacterales bacterium]MBV9368090.1 MinD/ParA family protein [Solirubrobacterales bacterium]MBV9809396.1 MinD/ParA family protein [Solirubrobacterales bacterium]
MEPGPLNGLDQVQEAELEQARQMRPAPERDVAPGPAPDAPGAEAPRRDAGARAAMSRQDVYAQPMRDGKPVPTGALTRFSTWLKYTLASELQRREWGLDEQLAHAPAMSRPNTVAVISPKGGVGKTTISFVLGNLLAEQLRLRVIALDANPDFGTLASLARDDHRSSRSLADLLADSSQIDSPAELHPYVARLPTGLHLLSAPAHAEVMAQMTPGLYGRLLDFLERFYEVVILDLGTGITDPLAQFAVDRADQTVVITTPEWVTAAGVLGALRYLQLERGTLVLNQAPTGRHAGNRDVIEANFRRHAVETSATIPYDDRLRVMLDTGTYALSALKLRTRVPVKELGATIAYNFV